MRRGLWLWAVIGSALLLNVTFLMQRASLEADNNRVELTVDYAGLVSVAEYVGMPSTELLSHWGQLGMTSVAVGDVGAVEADEASGDLVPDPSGDRPSMAPDERLRTLPPNIRIVPRTLAIADAASALRLDVGPFVPEGDAVEGYPDRLDAVAAALAALGLPVGVVEFATVDGVPDVVQRLGYDAVFVHSIPRRELAHLSDGQALARFHRAVFERQARLLYIHPLLNDSAVASELLQRNDAYIKAIVDRVRKAGLHIGPVRPVPNWATPPWSPVAAVVAAVAALLLFLGRWRGGPRLAVPVLLEAGLCVGAGLVVAWLMAKGHVIFARQAAALAVALTFPALAIAAATRPGEPTTSAPGRRASVTHRAAPTDSVEHSSPIQRMLRVFVGLLIVVGLSGVAAVLVAGALGDSPFLLKMEQFRGVKLAHVVPFGLLAGLSLFGDRQRFELSKFRIDFNWKHALLVVALLGIGFVFVARTGHDLLPVSQLERGLREWLETALPVRPRTKEFVLGYPALLAGLLLAVGSRRRWSVPLLIVGAVVPVSIVNTFAHAHIPLWVSTVRSVYGLLLGVVVAALFGSAAALAGRFVIGRGTRRRSEKGERL